MTKISFENIRRTARRVGSHVMLIREKLRRISLRSWIYIAIALVIVGGGLYWFLRPAPPGPVLPIVEVEPVKTDDVEIYGEYVGRIRAQQFV